MKVIEVTFRTAKGGHGPIAEMPFHPSHGKICHQTSSRNWKIEKSLVFQRPVNGTQVNIEERFGFGRERYDHSGQFNRNIQDSPVWPFYNQLISDMFPR